MQQFLSRKQGKLLLSKSQSVVEFLVSILIFSIAFISLLILVNNYLNALKSTKERVIANFLAQEGVELIVAKRNIERINNNTDFQNIFSSNNYCIDYTLNLINTNAACDLYIDNNGFYTHTPTPSSTIFRRLISISNNGDFVIVTSTVEFLNQRVELTTVLTPWF